MARRNNPRAQRLLRCGAWLVVAVAVHQASRGSTALGGPELGLVLAGLLATVLHLTRPRRTRRNTHR